MSQPNIVLIQVDQLTALALSAYGNGLAKTPNIDRLAAEGVVFENAYCNFPLCAPSRFSMMSGKLASRIGAYDNGAELPSTIPTLAHYLRRLNYRTCLSGKMHFVGADQLHGYAERVTSDVYPADFAWAADWEISEHRDTNDPRAVRISGVSETSVQIDYDEQVTERAVDWLNALADTRDQPFHLTVSFTHPHDPFVCQQQDWDVYEGVDIPLPAVPEPLTDDKQTITSIALLGMSNANFTADEIRTARRGYYGSITYVDRKVGEVLSALERHPNTIVAFTSDHGEMLGEHGLWMKRSFLEPAARVPLIFHAPWLFGPGRLSEPVSLVDILPTFLGFAAGNTDALVEDVDGSDLSAVIQGVSPCPNRPVLAELTCEGTPAPVVMVREGSLKYVASSVYAPRLFDVAADPMEVSNLSEVPTMAEAEARLAAIVAREWDFALLSANIRLSQRRRHFVQRAHQTTGEKPDWDYRESETPDDRWMRSGMSYNQWAYGTVKVED